MDTTAAAAAAALQVSASPGTSEAISAARHPQTVETQLNFKMICTNGTHTYTHTGEKESERDGNTQAHTYIGSRHEKIAASAILSRAANYASIHFLAD
jgi:hypothetical protein